MIGLLHRALLRAVLLIVAVGYPQQASGQPEPPSPRLNAAYEDWRFLRYNDVFLNVDGGRLWWSCGELHLADSNSARDLWWIQESPAQIQTLRVDERNPNVIAGLFRTLPFTYAGEGWVGFFAACIVTEHEKGQATVQKMQPSRLYLEVIHAETGDVVQVLDSLLIGRYASNGEVTTDGSSTQRWYHEVPLQGLQEGQRYVVRIRLQNAFTRPEITLFQRSNWISTSWERPGPGREGGSVAVRDSLKALYEDSLYHSVEREIDRYGRLLRSEFNAGSLNKQFEEEHIVWTDQPDGTRSWAYRQPDHPTERIDAFQFTIDAVDAPSGYSCRVQSSVQPRNGVVEIVGVDTQSHQHFRIEQPIRAGQSIVDFVLPEHTQPYCVVIADDLGRLVGIWEPWKE